MLVFAYAILITGSTYAYLSISASKNNVTAQAGCFEVNYTGEEITHTNLSATTNYLEGAKSTVTISKHNSCKIYNEAYIYIHVDENITAPIETVQALRYKVMQGDNQISEGLIDKKGEVLLATVPITNTSTNYIIYIWVDSSLSNKQYDETKFTGYIYAESDQTSTIETSHQVTFDLNGGSVPNLIYGLDNKSETTANYMKYSINNGVVTVTALRDDGYGNTTGKVYLESGKTYRFSCTTNGTWGGGFDDTVEVFLMFEEQYSLYYGMDTSSMNKNGYYDFSPAKTGTYLLRLEVNKNGQTHTFSNISIKEKDLVDGTKQVTYRKPYGSLPTPVRTGYTFKGWNGKNYYNINDKLKSITAGVTKDSSDWITINTSNGLQYYNYFTKNLNVLNDTYYLIILETKNISNQSGSLYVTSQGAATHQFNSTYFPANMLESNHIYLSETKTRTNPTDDTGIRTFYSNGRDTNNQFVTNSILTFRISVLDIDDSITENNFVYEPYFITKDTLVTQNKDHTLTAIWEED